MSNVFDRLTSKEKQDAADQTTGVNQKSNGRTNHDQSNEVAGSHLDKESTGTEKIIKDTAQELLRSGTIDEARKPTLFRASVTHEHRINQVLEPFDLSLRLDTHRGVAWLAVEQLDDLPDGDAWSHPLVRRQRLTLEQSLLVALLRQAFAMHEQKHGIGQSVARLSIEDLLPQFMTYFIDTGSDAKNESRLLGLLDQLKTYTIVSEVDKNQELTIRPMIAHLANPESLSALLKALQIKAGDTDAISNADSRDTAKENQQGEGNKKDDRKQDNKRE